MDTVAALPPQLEPRKVSLMVTLYDFQADRERGLAIAVRRAMHAFFAREMAAANEAAAA